MNSISFTQTKYKQYLAENTSLISFVLLRNENNDMRQSPRVFEPRTLKWLFEAFLKLIKQDSETSFG